MIQYQQVKETLRNEDDFHKMECLTLALKAYSLTDILDLIIEVSVESPSFILTESVLSCLKTEFALLGAETAVHCFKKWIRLAEANLLNSRNLCALIDFAVRSVSVMGNAKWRSAIRTELPHLHNALRNLRKYGFAGLLSRSLLYVIIYEASYCDSANYEELTSCWSMLLLSKGASQSPLLNLSSFLVDSAVGNDYSAHLMILFSKEDDFLEIDVSPEDSVICERTQFFSLLLSHLAAIIPHLSSLQTLILMRALVQFHSKNGTVSIFVEGFTRTRNQKYILV
ncbi:hypothetical protein AB6A40_002225 [Gnathostoma spinigerum]|uniref:Uncharacterized protein n=1 Tax=Gnathostoma spinigerum TaxID=75299 RepID=A0ABD6E7C5_9BILA